MSTKAVPMTVGHPHGLWLRGWFICTIAAVAVAALIVGILGLHSGAPAGTTTRPAGTTAIYQQSGTISGTGPDLVQVARAQASQRSVPITGTGPDLVQVAGRP